LSPILVRPVREQLEHDRVIRILQARLKRKYDVAINVGDEQAAGLKIGVGQMFPDLLLTSQDKGRRLEGIIEVETAESVNHLEAMAQWAHFGRARAPFHLYVPVAAVDIARRLCAENQVDVAEVWSYHTIADQTRFTLVHRNNAKDTKSTKDTKGAKDTKKAKAPKAVKPGKSAKSAKSAKSSKPAKPKRK